jgi:PQQ-like domain
MNPKWNRFLFWVLPCVFLTCLLFCKGNAYGQTLDSGSWPTLGHDDQRTNRSTFVGPSTPGTPKLLYDAGSPIGLENVTVTSDGKIVMSSCSTKVVAINPSGGVLWTFLFDGTYNESGYGLTASSDGRTLVSVNDCPDIPGGQPMHFYSLNADGTLHWAVNQSGMYGSPAIASDGTIYQGDEFARISAYNPANGAVLWTTSLCCFGNRSVALDSNGNLYIATDGGNYGSTSLWSLTPTGSVRWSEGTGNFVSVVIGPGDAIYAINTTGTLYCYHTDGSECWPGYNTGGSAGENSLAVSSVGTVYAKTSPGLFAVKPDGTSAWPSPFSPGGDPALSPSAVVDGNGVIYVGFGDNVYALNPDESVRPGWPVTVPSAGQIVVGGNGVLYVVSAGQKLYSIGSVPGFLSFPLAGKFPDNTENAFKCDRDNQSNDCVAAISAVFDHDVKPNPVTKAPHFYTFNTRVGAYTGEEGVQDCGYAPCPEPLFPSGTSGGNARSSSGLVGYKNSSTYHSSLTATIRGAANASMGRAVTFSSIPDMQAMTIRHQWEQRSSRRRTDCSLYRRVPHIRSASP